MGDTRTALGMRGPECWTDIWQAISPEIAQVMATGEATWHEDQYLPIERNGRLEDVWWTYSYSPVFDDDGSIGGTLVVCLETTSRILAERERAQLLMDTESAEQALLDVGSRYRTLFETLDAGFSVVEVLFDEDERPIDYRFVEANPAFERHTGLSGVVGRTARDLVPDLEPHWFETYGQVALTGEPMRFESGSDVMARWFEVYAFRIGRPEERQVALLFTDVSDARSAASERDRLLAELEVERSRLAYVFKQAPSFLAVLRGPDHVFALVNDAYYQLVGHRSVVGKPVWEALPEVRGQGFEALLDGVLATGEPFVGRELPITVARTKGAPPEERFIDLTYLPLVEGDGVRAGVIAHGVDVTEQVLARRDVERLLAESERARAEAETARGDADRARGEAEVARQAAEAANRAKAEFLATMSHELRTPLNAIGGYAELMEMGIRGPITAEQLQDLGRIQASQRHLLGLVNQVLDLARDEAGALHVELAAVRSGDTVDAALALVRPQAEAKSIILSTACAGAADRPYLGDEPRVRQALVNLLANAIKFTPSGGRISVDCMLTESPPSGLSLPAGVPYLALRIEDTGVGIPLEEHERIFEPFTQVEAGSSPYTRSTSGTGLGLAISRRLARLMGGDLTVDSKVGVGSTFTLWLPTLELRSIRRPRAGGTRDSGPRVAVPGDAGSAADATTTIARIGAALAGEAGPAIETWVARLRSDPAVPTDGITDYDLEDHVATFVTDIGLALRTLGESSAEPAEAQLDSRAILAVVAERHGAQRARLGWSEATVAHELALLGEILEEAVVRLAGPEYVSEVERALAAVSQLLAQALRISLGGFRATAGSDPTK